MLREYRTTTVKVRIPAIWVAKREKNLPHSSPSQRRLRLRASTMPAMICHVPQPPPEGHQEAGLSQALKWSHPKIIRRRSIKNGL
ncbi:hypothetical protein PanWU01x14_017500 [Parasponia andersonii]|uniref:Uncharacterized protein n=1 Tax=Parasponia andersonii TaxID=3476 RepID=A0A2P5DZY4_PARAD|nr:hypothetical protein PanWU01x14_017500 [Parasponia andersonii]